MNKKIGCILLMVFMWLIGIKGTIAVLSDNNPMHYNNLPMLVVYVLLMLYLIVTIVVSIKSIKSIKKLKNN